MTDAVLESGRGPQAGLPYLTTDLPGIGGVLKQRPEDFEVEEVPAYHPAGEGEFLYLWIEKRNLSAEHLVAELARTFGISRQEIGMAGLKDRQAVTRQYVSVPAHCGERLDQLRHPGLRVLSAARHRNKLRAGHLRGNRFSLLVRDVADDAPERATAVRERIERFGCPNYFGEQRFGQDAETSQLGFDLLHGRRGPESIPRGRRKFLLRLALSAAQSVLFNEALATRLTDGLLHRVLVGDVMQVVASGGLFVVDDAEREQSRFEAGETVVTGPMFGPKMKPPQGEPAGREQRLLEHHQLSMESFARFPRLTAGTRRPYLVRPGDLSIESDPEGLRFRFTLPAGVYATVLLREFQKP